MKKILIIAGLLVFAVVGLFGQQATIQELTGTVELKREDSAGWESAVLGQTITGGTIISTGFKSHALISIGSSSVNVRPLTRLSVAELQAAQGTETINVNLQTGRVRADVKAPVGSRAAFNIVSPMATASVRGTIFEVSTYTLKVIEGSVEYKGRSGASVIVGAGGTSQVDEKSGRVIFTKEILLASLSPEQPIAYSSVNAYRNAGAAVQQQRNTELSGELDFSN